MTPEVLDFIPVSLDDTDKQIEVADGHDITAKQKGQVWTKLCDNKGEPFITTFHNVILAPGLYDELFLIITLMNLGQICLFRKGFCNVYLRSKEKIHVHQHIVHKGNIHFGGKSKKF